MFALSFRRNAFDNLKFQDTIEFVKRIAKEYRYMTAPFSFDMVIDDIPYTFHVLIICGKSTYTAYKISNPSAVDTSSSSSEVGRVSQFSRFLRESTLPFHAHVIGQKEPSKRTSPKLPFFAGEYSFDYRMVFNENGHINNNEELKDNFIDALKDGVSDRVRNHKMEGMDFILNNDFTYYLSLNKRIVRSEISITGLMGFHCQLNEGFNHFVNSILKYRTILNNEANNKTRNSDRYESLRDKDAKESLKNIQFYDALNDIVNSSIDIYYSSDQSWNWNPPQFHWYKSFYTKRFNTAYTKELTSHQKAIIKYLRKLKIDWELAALCNYDKDSYAEKYSLLNKSKKVCLPSGKQVFPRLDFVNTYPAIVQSSSVDELKALMPHIDALKPLNDVKLSIFGRELAPSERRALVGRFLQCHDFQHAKALMKSIFLNMTVSNAMPLSDQRFTYDVVKPTSFVCDFYSFFSNYVDGYNDFIQAVPKNMSIESFIFHLCQLFDRRDFKTEYKVILSFFNPEDKYVKAILKRLDKKFTTISFDNIRQEGMNADYNCEKYSDMRHEVMIETIKVRSESRRQSSDRETLEEHFDGLHENIGCYLGYHYYPAFRKTAIKRDINNLSDSFFLFDQRVLQPICAYLAGKPDGSLTCHNEEDIKERNKAVFKLFAHGSKNLLNVIKLSYKVHDNNPVFREAGKNPASLLIRDNEFFGIDTKSKDTIREEFGLSSHYEWVAGINGIFEASYNDADYVVIPLINQDELEEEGKAMHNCVGWANYASKSMSGLSKIFSIRKREFGGEFERFATLELGYNIGEKSVYIKQNYGPHNSVDDEVKMIGIAFSGALYKQWEDDFIIPWKAIAIEQQRHKMDKGISARIAQDAGYYPSSKEAIMAAMKPWLPYLDKKYHDIEAYGDLEIVKKRIESIM